MRCRCPACGRNISVPPEQVDFLYRCESCKALFIARSPEAVEEAQRLAAMETSLEPKPSLPRVHLSELLGRAPPRMVPAAAPVMETAGEDLEELARQSMLPAPPRPPKQINRFQLQLKHRALGVMGLFGLLAVILLLLSVALLRFSPFSSPANAHAESPPIAERQSAKTAQSVPPAPPTTAEPSGELFPNVKPQP